MKANNQIPKLTPQVIPIWSCFVACIGLCLAWAPAAEGATPSDIVSKTSTAVIDVLQNKDLGLLEKRANIEKIVYANVDFDVVSRLVLARNWSKFNDAQQAEFISEFKKHISATYSKNIDSFNNEKVVIDGEREEARGDRTVLTRILRSGGGEPFLVQYRLRKKGEQWMIIDVIVEGVSMISNFRSQFQEIMTKGGPDHLLELLREKSAAAEKELEGK